MADWRPSSGQLPGMPCSTSLGLVKSSLPEVDLNPVGDGVPEDYYDADWEANHTIVLEIAERIVAEL